MSIEFTQRALSGRAQFPWSRAGGIAWIMVAAFAWSAAARAADVGSVRGVVHDSGHLPIAQASVKLKSATSDWQQSTATDDHGEFAFMTVPLGDYVLMVSQGDYAAATQLVSVASGSFPVAHIQLAKGPTLDTVTVTAAADTSVPNTATPTTVVSRQDIQRTPGADRSNSLAMITNYVPGAYVVHDQLHVRGGHQTTWAIDGVEIPNTNIASNLGPQIDPKDIDYLEVQRGSYQADQGDRTYGIFNVVPRTGFERDNQAELIASAGNFAQTNDYLSIGSHTERFAYYASVNGNRSDLGIQTPVAQIIHDTESGYGGFSTLIFNATGDDQFRLVVSARHDNYDIPNVPGQMAADVQRETDTFAILSWVRKLNEDAALTTSLFYHQNRADLDGAGDDSPTSTTDQRASTYVGGQETLRLHWTRHDLQIGVTGFGQRDDESFMVLFNDGSSLAPINQRLKPTGSLVAAYIEDNFAVTDWLRFAGGVRQTHFDGDLTENATSPRLGLTIRLPHLEWLLRGFWGKYYQAPPLTTLSGPLLQFAQNNDLGFLPLHGERDEEYQIGLTVPFHGWTIDIDRFHTAAKNFFDHNNIGNSNAFLPLTIDGAVIVGTELSIRSPKFWSMGSAHLTYSNQTANGFGAINGGLTDFEPAGGRFALDHDQRNTANIGFDANLPWQAFASADISIGSGFANEDGPSHLQGHAELNVSAGKNFGPNLTASLTILNVTDKHLLVDNSLTFGGVHYNDPRQIYAQIHYKFGY